MEQAKRDCILVEAARAFGRFGFKKASVDEIARGAGVAKGTVYLACESKEDLYYQVLHREVRAWVAAVAKSIDPRQPADELLERVSIAGFAYLEAHPLVKELLFGTAVETLPRWSDRLDELRSLGRANVVEILRLGIRQGIFRAKLDLEPVATLLQDMQVAAYLLHPNLSSQPDDFERLRRAALEVILNGLRAQPTA